MRLTSAAIVLSLVFGMLASASCGYPSIEGDPVDDSARASDDSESEGGTDTDSASPNPGVAADATTTSSICTENDVVLCFRFEGDTKDESAAPLTPATTTGITFAPGKDGQSAVFGANSALRFAPNAAFELPAKSATIEAWVKRQNNGADAVVFDDDNRFSLTINGSGKVWCRSTGGTLVGTSVVPVDQWAHVACVIDNGTMNVYVNGTLAPQGAGSVGSSPNAAAAIGGNSPSGDPFLGAIDSFRVFKVARTPEQIAAAAQ